MTDEDFVFALRDYDNGKIFQRKFFADLNLPDKTDEEILADTSAQDGDTLETLQRKIAVAEKLQQKIADYQKRISRHVRRLEKYLHAIEQKGIVDTSADIAALRKKYAKARNLIVKYADKIFPERNPNDKYDEQPITIYISKITPATRILDGLYVELSDSCLKELYKAERNYYRKIFAERLKAARKAAKLSQDKLGARVGLNQGNISDYENMLYEPNLTVQVKLAQELNKPVGWFLGVN